MKLTITKEGDLFIARLTDNGKFVSSSGHDSVAQVKDMFLPNCRKTFPDREIEVIDLSGFRNGGIVLGRKDLSREVTGERYWGCHDCDKGSLCNIFSKRVDFSIDDGEFTKLLDKKLNELRKER